MNRRILLSPGALRLYGQSPWCAIPLPTTTPASNHLQRHATGHNRAATESRYCLENIKNFNHNRRREEKLFEIKQINRDFS
ncbi:hypothetical protein GKC30_06655 [Pseudodesulfovibrio sp. F-1]|uniref:Uncharacterized protein n=1 Tax=Pseudodesulfovibrio alkaliphilus TaxID=2661613 RepID=A0A7K1KMQ7_9BACT|nr:hypothetical protein [Pseudodesulfovibrio alkaliphilus]